MTRETLGLAKLLRGVACGSLILGALGCTLLSPPFDGSYPVFSHGRLLSAWVGPHSCSLEVVVDGTRHYFEAGEPAPEQGERTFGRTRELRPISARRWRKRIATELPARVAPPEEWARCRDRMAQRLLPPEAGEGVAIAFADRTLYVTPRGQEPHIRAVCSLSPPDGWRFDRRHDVRDLKDVAFPTLLGDRDEAPSAIVFQTGEEGSGGFPFVCVRPDSEDLVTLTLAPDRPGVGRRLRDFGRQLGCRLRLLPVLAYSNTVALIEHPLRAPTTLLLSLKDSVENRVQGIDLSLRRFPELRRRGVPPVRTGQTGMDLASFGEFLDRLCSEPASHASLDFLIGGREYFSRLEAAIAGARESIHMQTYIFDNDDTALRIADQLKERSGHADVRVLCDGLGTTLATTASPESVPLQRVDTPACMARYLEQDSNVRVRYVPNTWFAGDHTKSITIDDDVAFLGGMNVGREYRHEWHDLMVEIRGPLVSRLDRLFLEKWDDCGTLGGVTSLFGGGRRKIAAGGSEHPRVHLLFTRPGRPEIYEAQLEALRRARSRVYLENAYFSDDRFLYEVCAARKRGVDVRVILTLRSNHGLMNRNNVVVVNTLLEHGVRVYRYPGMTHVKAAVFDGWACFGSANLDKMSLRTNRELNLATSDPTTVQRLLDDLFLEDMAGSLEITRPLDENVVDRLAEFVSDSL